MLEGMCDWVFDEMPDGELVLTTTGALIVGIIDTIVRELGEDNVWGQILTGGADLGEILTNLRLGSRITFFAEPAFPSGLIAESDTEEIWQSVSYRWALALPAEDRNDPDLGWEQVSLSAIVDEAIVGHFSGSVDPQTTNGHAPGTLLLVDPHPLAIKYGAILNYLLQHEILPRIAGGIPADGLPVVDSYSEMFKVLLAGRECLAAENTGNDTCCAMFTRSVLGEDPLIPESIVSTGCEMLIEFGSLYIEGLLLGLDTETGESFRIGSPQDTPCLLDDANLDGTVDTLGTVDEWGQWEATLTLGGLPVTVDGIFLGGRD